MSRELLSDSRQEMITQAHCWTAEIEQRLMHGRNAEFLRPFHLMKPKLFIDGDQWCALYGEDLASGLAGFGDSPEKAAWAFDQAFGTSLKKDRP